MLSQRAVQVWLSKWMAACMIAAILFSNARLAFAEEISRDAVEAGSDVTISFGEEEENKIRIHVNQVPQDPYDPASADAEADEVVPETETEETQSEPSDGSRKEYIYEDSSIKVVAALQYAEAVPDGAELRAVQITPQSGGDQYSAYMDALNDSNPDAAFAYSGENTLLYDIGFYVKKQDENGQPIEGSEYEYEPEEGSVVVSVEFKKSQLTDEIGITNSSDISVTHLPLKEDIRERADGAVDAAQIRASDIQPEAVSVQDESVVLRHDGADEITFQTGSFSTYAFSNGTAAQIQTVEDFDLASYLGTGNNYGIIVNTYVHRGDTETNVMAGTYQSSAAEVGASMNYSNAGGNYYFGSLIGFSNGSILRFHQAPAVVFLGPTATGQYDRGEFQFDHLGDGTVVRNSTIDVAAVIQSIGTKFDQLDSLGGTFDKTIDLTNLPAGTYIVKFDGDRLDENTLDLRLNPNQRLIMNCTSTNLTIQRYHINGQQPSAYISKQEESIDWLTHAVVFNMVNDGTVYMEESMGVVINPNGAVNTGGGACAGVMVADSTNGSNEWHYHNHSLDSPDSRNLKAYKNIDRRSANVNGFRFILSEKQGGAWEQLQTKINIGQDITFDSIIYDRNNCPNEVNEFVYKIEESEDLTSVDDSDTEYLTDSSVYYAKIVVNRYISGEETSYVASNPVYYVDEACTNRLDGVPVFQNESTKTNLTIRKAWRAKDGSVLSGPEPVNSITFTLYRAESTEGAFETPPTEGGTAVGTYTIQKDGADVSSLSDDWTLTIPNLPLQTTEGGITRYYGYYVVENPLIQDYEVSDGNYSLTTHEITITNTEEERTSITVNKKWFKGTDETAGPAEPVTFDLYRTESTEQPEEDSQSTSVSLMSQSDEGVITEYSLGLKTGYYWWENERKRSYSVHAGDTVHIEATSRGPAILQVIAGWPYQERLQKTVDPAETVAGSKTTTIFDYKVPPVEKIYKSENEIYEVTEYYLGLYFNNEKSDDDSVAVNIIPAARMMASAASSADMRQEDALSRGGSCEWDGETHRYQLSAENGWTMTFPSLPIKGTNSEGETVYYSYHVVEHAGSAYDVSETTYENNSGIQSGTITIRNKLPDVTYTYTNLSAVKRWMSAEGKDITKTRDGSVSFVLKQVAYQGSGLVADSDKNAYTGGNLQEAEGISFDEATGRYTITAQPDGTDASGNTIWRWPAALISGLPLEVKAEDGTVLRSFRYYVEEVDTNGSVNVTYKVGSGDELGYCEESNDGSAVTMINREMATYNLPATGGPGTRLFTILGSILILGAGALLWRKRRLFI